jgi:hypothetical protein
MGRVAPRIARRGRLRNSLGFAEECPRRRVQLPGLRPRDPVHRPGAGRDTATCADRRVTTRSCAASTACRERAYCEPCAWHRAFWQRRQPQRVTGSNCTWAERRRWPRDQLAKAKADRPVEVAAVKARGLDPDDERERQALVRTQLRAEIGDLQAELRDP